MLKSACGSNSSPSIRVVLFARGLEGQVRYFRGAKGDLSGPLLSRRNYEGGFQKGKSSARLLGVLTGPTTFPCPDDLPPQLLGVSSTRGPARWAQLVAFRSAKVARPSSSVRSTSEGGNVLRCSSRPVDRTVHPASELPCLRGVWKVRSATFAERKATYQVRYFRGAKGDTRRIAPIPATRSGPCVRDAGDVRSENLGRG